MNRQYKIKVVNCPECNLPCATHKLGPHLNGNFCPGSEHKIVTSEDMELYLLWKRKKNNYIGSRESEVKYLLTLSELGSLLSDAGISVSQVGNGPGKYNLSRFGDKGNYEIGNCRFILQVENILEKEYGLRYIIEGTTYSSPKQAAKDWNCGKATIRRRCESSKFPNWKLVQV